jgi:Domain of unknown function (DUF3303)
VHVAGPAADDVLKHHGNKTKVPSRVVILDPMVDISTDSDARENLYMVVERFKNKDALPVYRRFRDKGRLTPEGLLYVSSWVDETFDCCYQLMRTRDPRLLDEWMANWTDLVDFEVRRVLTSEEAVERISAQL